MKEPEDYWYLNQHEADEEADVLYEVDGMDDAEEFDITLKCMKTVGFSEKEIDEIQSVLVAILNLGNVKFADAKRGECKLDEDTLDFSSKFGNYLGIKEAADVESLLTKMYKETMGEEMYITYSPDNAVLARDSLAKLIFKKVFDFICAKLNESLNKGFDTSKRNKNKLFTGILDIFGFEIFRFNSFE